MPGMVFSLKADPERKYQISRVLPDGAKFVSLKTGAPFVLTRERIFALMTCDVLTQFQRDMVDLLK